MNDLYFTAINKKGLEIKSLSQKVYIIITEFQYTLKRDDMQKRAIFSLFLMICAQTSCVMICHYSVMDKNGSSSSRFGSWVLPLGVEFLVITLVLLIVCAISSPGKIPPRRYAAQRWLRHAVAVQLLSPIKNTDIKSVSFIGGGSWIRTSEVSDNRFTVCPLWPLGNSPIEYGAGERSRTINLLITNQLLCH